MSTTVLKTEGAVQTQVCKCCGRELPISDFRVSRLGRLQTCKECVRRNQVAGHMNKKMAVKKSNEIEEARTARLQDFKPRELMAELKRRGYEFVMKYAEVHVIDSKTL